MLYSVSAPPCLAVATSCHRGSARHSVLTLEGGLSMPESKRSSQTTLLGKLRDFLNTPLPGAPRPKSAPEPAEALLAETPPSGPVETLVMTDTLDVVEAPTSPEMLTEITNSDASLSVPSVSEALLINEAETLTAEPIEA